MFSHSWNNIYVAWMPHNFQSWDAQFFESILRWNWCSKQCSRNIWSGDRSQSTLHQIFNRFKVLNNPNVQQSLAHELKATQWACESSGWGDLLCNQKRNTTLRWSRKQFHIYFDLFDRHFYCLSWVALCIGCIIVAYLLRLRCLLFFSSSSRHR